MGADFLRICSAEYFTTDTRFAGSRWIYSPRCRCPGFGMDSMETKVVFASRASAKRTGVATQSKSKALLDLIPPG